VGLRGADQHALLLYRNDQSEIAYPEEFCFDAVCRPDEAGLLLAAMAFLKMGARLESTAVPKVAGGFLSNGR
jgi:hypothetical protein